MTSDEPPFKLLERSFSLWPNRMPRGANLIFSVSAMASNDRTVNIATGDAGPGTGLGDLLPTPAANPTDESQHGGRNATLSHALAVDDHAEKGHAQQNHEKEVRDLGWNEPKQEIAAPLVGGMDNEELWLLIRRFDKARQCQECRMRRVG